MRAVVLALMFASYFFLSLIVAALLWRASGGWSAGVAAFVGTFSFALAIHALVSGALSIGNVQAELRDLRQANRLMADSIERAHTAIADLSAVEQLQVRRADEITGEVRVLEDLVARIGESMAARMAQLTAESLAGPARRLEDDRRAALLQQVRDALAEGRVDLYLQPVVSLPQRKTVFYESFSRLRDESGRVMMPAEYLAVAEPEGLVTAVDNLLLFRCVQIVRRLARQDRKVGIFCNISLASLGDEQFFPRFLEFLADNRDLAGALIFELGQAAFEERGATEARNMAKLADLGFRFSLDKVSSLDLNLADLGRSDVKFVKIGASVLIEQLAGEDGSLALGRMRDIHAADYAGLMRRYGVEPIAEKVENERQAVEVLELDVAYGQGHLFGEPRAIREQVLAEATPPAELVEPVLRRRVAGGMR